MGDCCSGEQKAELLLEEKSKESLSNTQPRTKQLSNIPSISNASKQINNSKSRHSQVVKPIKGYLS